MSVPSVWTANFNIKSVKVSQPELAQPASDALLRSMLQRKYSPLDAATGIKLNMECHGIYSIPDYLKAKMVSFICL
jgi:hypothetical protein